MENEIKKVNSKENEKIEKEFETSKKVNKSENEKLEDEHEKNLKIEMYYIDNEDPDVEDENANILLNAA